MSRSFQLLQSSQMAAFIIAQVPPGPLAQEDAITRMRWWAWLVLDNGKGAADTMLEHQSSGFKLVGLCE